MATASTNAKNRLIVFLSAAVLSGLLIVSVDKCSHYKATAEAYQDSTRIYKNSAAFFKVKSSEQCREKIDSLKVWYLKTKQQDEAQIKTLTTDAPAWLR